MKTLVDKCRHLEVDPLSNGQPVEVTQDRCDVIELPRLGDESGCGVLDRLQFCQQTAGDSRQKTVAVVHAAADKRGDQ